MSTASSHSPTELNDGKEGRGRSASVMDELRVLKEERNEDESVCREVLY